MKPRILPILLLFILLLSGKISYPQTKPAYQVPDNYSFDYEVVQVSRGKKNPNDSTTMRYLYTKSGEYAGLKLNEKRGDEKLIIFTKDGNSIIFDDSKKDITIINMQAMMKSFAGMAKGMHTDSTSKGKFDPSRFKSVKTGNTKIISGYTAEEYKVTDSGKYKASIWYAKVDFNTQLYYLLGMGGMGAASMMKMGGNPMNGNPMLQTITDPKALITEIVTPEEEGKGTNMYTKSIESTPTSVSTKGYKVNDYSNMDFKQMIEESQKRGK